MKEEFYLRRKKKKKSASLNYPLNKLDEFQSGKLEKEKTYEAWAQTQLCGSSSGDAAGSEWDTLVFIQ